MIDKLHPEPAFTDPRGDITNLLAFPVQHVALITSTPGAVRGNHVHQTDSHFTYLLSGHCDYHQVVDGVVESCCMEAGDLILTPAGAPHALVAAEESVFLAFCTAERGGGKYEEDTLPWNVLGRLAEGPDG